jgi:hypothetical protein
VLNGLVDWLDCAPFPENVAEAAIRIPGGEVWTSNSSYENATTISKASVGAYRAAISDAVAQAIEVLCGPEMCALNYLGSIPAAPIPAELEDLCRKPREDLIEYCWGSSLRDQERARLEELAVRHFDAPLHLLPRAFDEFSAFMSSNSRSDATGLNQ